MAAERGQLAEQALLGQARTCAVGLNDGKPRAPQGLHREYTGNIQEFNREYNYN